MECQDARYMIDIMYLNAITAGNTIITPKTVQTKTTTLPVENVRDHMKLRAADLSMKNAQTARLQIRLFQTTTTPSPIIVLPTFVKNKYSLREPTMGEKTSFGYKYQYSIRL